MPTLSSDQPGIVAGQATQALSGPGRLIVLVSDADADDVQLASRIWNLAVQRTSSVLLLALYEMDEEHARVRRQLVSLAAAVRDPHTSVEILTRPGRDWIRQIEAVWRPGDLLVCTLQPGRPRSASPAAQVLASNLRIPVHVLTGGASQYEKSEKPGKTLLVWGGNLGVVAAFFLLQSSLGEMTGSPLGAILLAASVIAEVGALWLWNTATG
jgi:hypothetical protein